MILNTDKYATYFPDAHRPAIEHYANTHPFYSASSNFGITLNDDAIQEYKEDIYRFARAAGIGKQTARIEVMRAVAAWERHVGLGNGLLLFEDEESDFEVQRKPRLRDAISYYPATTVVQSVEVPVMGESRKNRKRKRAEAEMEVVVAKGPMPWTQLGPEDREKKKQRRREKKLLQRERKSQKAEKAESKKQAREEKLQITTTSTQLESADVSMTDEPERTQPTFHKAPPVFTTTSEPKKKRRKPGPTTSSYFSKPETAGGAEKTIASVGSLNTTPGNGEGKSKRKKRKKNNNRLSETSLQTPAISNTIQPPAPVPSSSEEFVEQHDPSSDMEDGKSPGAFLEDLYAANNHSSPSKSGSSRPVDQGYSLAMDVDSESPNEQSSAHEQVPSSINSSHSQQHRKRRDRGRRNSQQPADITIHEDIPEALSELNDTNAKTPKLQRRDRGKKSKTEPIVRDVSTDQELKVHHS